MREQGAEVFSALELKDIRLGPDGLSAVEVQTIDQVLDVTGTEFYSFLTRHEWEYLNSRCAQSLFVNSQKLPVCRWQRWEVEFSSNRLMNHLPEEVLVLGDIYDVWKYDNLALMRRSETGWHIWMKVDQGSSTEDLRQVLQRFVARLMGRVPGIELESVKLGSTESLWAIWDQAQRADHIQMEVQNCKMLGPDGGERFDQLSRWHHGEATIDWLLKRVMAREGEKEAVL